MSIASAMGLSSKASELAARLRGEGVRVGVGEVVAAVRALAVIDVASRDDVRLAMRAVLCSRQEDLARFDAAFDAVFGDLDGDGQGDDADPSASAPGPEAEDAGDPGATGGRADDGGDEPSPDDDATAIPAAWSDVALDRTKSFARYTDEERAALQRVLERLAHRTPQRRSRRTRPSRRRHDRADMRATIRASLPHFGVPIDRRWRAPTQRPRQLVLVCDVSGSMEPYARVWLQYLQACVTARRRVEAFAFGTRLTRITRELATRDADEALARAAKAVTDWSGGTRIGESLAELNRRHGRLIGRGATVIVLSDGWDRGDPELLAAEMARLRRASHSVVWLNPLAAQPEFEPLARGMQAALPHTAHLLPGESLASLEQLAEILEAL